MRVDLKREISAYTAPRGRFEVVVVPRMQFLMVDGAGDPDTAPAWADALRTVYPVAYRLRALSRSRYQRDHTVMPLEALWWSDDMATFTTARDEARWKWTVLNAVPDWLTAEDLDVARAAVERAGGAPALGALRLEPYDEGRCVQTLHVGPYDDEGPVLAAMHDEFLPAHGLTRTGRHHEIYLGDARRTAPERLRTVLRLPVAAAAPPG